MPEGDETGPEGKGQRTGRGKGSSLEERVSIFDSIGKSLEDLVGAVKEIPRIAKEAVYYTYYTAKAALGLAAGVAIAGVPALFTAAGAGLGLVTSVLKAGYAILIFPACMAGGTALANWKNGEKTTFKQIANELAVGGLLGGFLHHIFSGSRYLISTAKSTYGTVAGFLTGTGCALAQVPPFLLTHEYLNRALIKDYKPKSLKDMGKQIKRMWPIIPPILANFTVVPEYLGHSYQMPIAAGIATTYGLLKAEPKKKEEKKQKAPAGYVPQSAGAPGYGM